MTTSGAATKRLAGYYVHLASATSPCSVRFGWSPQPVAATQA